ncbi:MAG: RecB family exonuclease, partial [Acidimicrobiales bacterium]
VELRSGRTARFGGSVDRVDRGSDGSLVVSDYKTGSQAALRDLKRDPVAAGTKLQLPTYALAAKAHLDWNGKVWARYWNVSWNRAFPSLLCDIDERLLERFNHVVATIAEGIEAGVFPGTPGDETFRRRRSTFENCVYCDFDAVCPTDRDLRWSVASRAPEVASVVELREPPDEQLAGMAVESPVEFTEVD